ncbi:MAG: hypothetical protein HZA93_23520 [Verrucomicrobia bacterium]|nr:hypothetical protein [Verrucomicrobiota bacterium]
MKLRVLLIAVGLCCGLAAGGRAAEARFSQSLSAGEIVETGLNRLSSDQVAVIDALVRRNPVDPAKPDARFSERLSDDERRAAGWALLTEAQRAKLDGLVTRQAAAASAAALMGPLVIAPARAPVRVAETKAAPGPHGSFFFSMGWGKGGYSEKSGGMTVNYEDPARGFAVSASYAETYVKGRGAYIYRDPITNLPPVIAP